MNGIVKLSLHQWAPRGKRASSAGRRGGPALRLPSIAVLFPKGTCLASLSALVLTALLVLPVFAAPIGVPIPRPTTAPAPVSPTTPFEAKLQEGALALNANNPDAAKAAFMEAMKLDAKSPTPLMGLAEVARVQNNAADYRKWLLQALDTAPQNADVQRAWGLYEFASGRFASSETSLKKAASLDPKSALTLVDLGDLYLQGMHRPADAAVAYRQAIKLRPNDAAAHVGLGRAFVAVRSYREAVPEFERAAALMPGDPLPSTELARTYGALGDLDKALAAYQTALTARPDFVPALLGRGDIYMERNEPARAVADFESAVKLEPKSAAAQFRLGSAYDALKRADDAEKSYRAAIAADSKYAPAYNNLAMLALESKHDTAMALDMAQRATALAPDVGAYADTMGGILLARGDLGPAIDAFRKASASKPDNPSFYYNLGQALARNGKKQEAIAAFRQALAVNPGFSNAAQARARIAELGGK